jgi:two-component system, response regulator PdtaR
MVHDPHAPVLLVVDDEAFVRLNGVMILEGAGYEVIEAASADEAIELLQNAPDVRLVFTDVDMPGSMNGVALAMVIHERWPNIRVLLTSGHHRLANSALPDCGRFISKPYSGETVVDQVGSLLRTTE